MTLNIEFVGLPGSGKSTFSKFLLRKYTSSISSNDAHASAICEAAGLRRIPFSSKIIQPIRDPLSSLTGIRYNAILSFQAKYSDVHKIFLQAVHRSNSTSRQHLTIKWMLTIEEKWWLIEEYVQEESVIWDEGIVHRALGLFHPPEMIEHPSEMDIRQYVECLPLPDIIVTMEVTPAIALERISDRSGGRPPAYDELTDDEMLKRLEEMDESLTYIKATCQESGARVISINNQHGERQAKIQLSEQFDEFLTN